MAAPYPLREPTAVRLSARPVDVAVAMLTVAGVVAFDFASPERLHPVGGPIQVAWFLGVVLLFRRRRPMAVLLLSIAAIFVYHLVLKQFSPAGWIWPVSAAYFTAATTPRVRWVAAIGVAQLVYSAV